VILATAENLPLTAGPRTTAVMSMVFFSPGPEHRQALTLLTGPCFEEESPHRSDACDLRRAPYEAAAIIEAFSAAFS